MAEEVDRAYDSESTGAVAFLSHFLRTSLFTVVTVVFSNIWEYGGIGRREMASMTFSPDRIVLGADSDRALVIMRSLYSPKIEMRVPWDGEDRAREFSGQVPMVETDLASSQIIKYTSNVSLPRAFPSYTGSFGCARKLGLR